MKVISNARLVRLACACPLNVNELVSAGLTNRQAQRFGHGILKALRSRQLPKLPPQPNQKHPPSDVVDRFKKLRLWRRELAAGRGVASDVILPNAVLWNLAENPPKNLDDIQHIPGIGPWRRSTYGPDIIEVLSNKG